MSRLCHVALLHVAVQRHTEDPLFVDRHAEDHQRLVEFREFVEQGAQIFRTAEHALDIGRCDEERAQSRIGRPCLRRKRMSGGQCRDLRAQEFNRRLDSRSQALVAVGQQFEPRIGQCDGFLYGSLNTRSGSN